MWVRGWSFPCRIFVQCTRLNLTIFQLCIRISGLVVEYIVAIDVTRVRFPADACLGSMGSLRLAIVVRALGPVVWVQAREWSIVISKGVLICFSFPFET